MDGSDGINRVTGTVIGAALKVHTRLGPGLLEHSYRRCLAHELRKAALKVEEEVPLNLIYDDLLVLGAYRLDLLVDDSIIIEIKTVEKLHRVHHSQLMTYLRLGQKPVGLLFNFQTKEKNFPMNTRMTYVFWEGKGK